MADALAILRKEKLKSFFIYDRERVIGEINHDELMLFLGYGENAESIYTHKLNFDLGSALIAIARMRNNDQQVLRRNTISKKLIIALGTAAIISVAVAGLALNFFKPFTTIPEVQNGQLRGLNKVVLTLSNGTEIPLSSEKSGVNLTSNLLRYYDGAEVSDKKLLTEGNKNEQVTLATSNGSMYQLILPDGTKVWLNDASTIKFAPSFDGKSPRRVELTGEAYFEVAKVNLKSSVLKAGQGGAQDRVPFIVLSKGQIIEVLGTHFNVTAYQNEGEVKTTLLEGQVAVTPLSKKKSEMLDFIPSGPIDATGGGFMDGKLILGATKLLKPNEQAVLNGSTITVNKVDIDESIAWKNGEFIFRNMPLERVMDVIARWYDVDVIYEKNKENAASLGGVISKSAKINEVLKTLELIANVHFKIEGRRVTVIQ